MTAPATTTLHNPRIDQLSIYPFTRLTELLESIEPPAGLAPIALHVGEPQLGPPDFVGRILAEKAPELGRYPPHAGTPELREAAARWLTRRFNLPQGSLTGAANVIAVAGTKEGLFHMGLLTVPGANDRDGRRPVVLMPNPVYQVYYGSAVFAGAEPVAVSAEADTNFMPDFAALDAETLDRARLCFLCSPGNPQGAVADADYLMATIRLARAHDFVLVVDECYSEIYRGTAPVGALEACARMGAPAGGGLYDNVLVFQSLSKRSSVPGLRCGYVAGDPRLIKAYQTIRSYGGVQIPMPAQAAAVALLEDESHVERTRAYYAKLFGLADRILGNTPGYRSSPGGFFLWLDVGDGEEAALRLWREAAVRVMPGGYFSQIDPATGRNPGDPYIRVALVHGPAVTEDGLTRMAQVLGH